MRSSLTGRSFSDVTASKPSPSIKLSGGLDLGSGKITFKRNPRLVGEFFGQGSLRIEDLRLGRSIRLPEFCRPLVSHSLFQRMRGVQQSAVRNVDGFRDIYYSRYTHSLGTGYEMTKLVVNSNLIKSDPELAQALVTAALIHDVPHGPFSHTIERVLANQSKFDHDQHFRDGIVNPKFRNERGQTFFEVLDQSLAHTRFDAESLVAALANKQSPIHIAAKSLGDRLDYIPRDLISFLNCPAGISKFENDPNFLDHLSNGKTGRDLWKSPHDLKRAVVEARDTVIANLYFEGGDIFLDTAGEQAMEFLANVRNVYTAHAPFDARSLLLAKLLKRDVTKAILELGAIPARELPVYDDRQLMSTLRKAFRSKQSRPRSAEFKNYSLLSSYGLCNDLSPEMRAAVFDKSFQTKTVSKIVDDLQLSHGWNIVVVYTPEKFTTPMQVAVKPRDFPLDRVEFKQYGQVMPDSLRQLSIFVHRDASDCREQIKDHIERGLGLRTGDA